MPSYRVCSRTRTYFGTSGQLLAGGSILFYQAGTTTPQDVYGEKELTTNNGSTVDLDSSGRPTVDCWADTSDRYFMEVYDSAGAKQYDEDDVELPGGVAQTIPALNEGEFLSGDGTNLLAVDLSNRLVPDPTGQSTKILGNDGTSPIWVAKPSDGAAGVSDIVIGTGSVKLSSGSSHVLQQWATDSVAGGGGLSVSKSVTFATAYSSAPVVEVEVTGTNPTSAGNIELKHRVVATTTGFTVTFDTHTGGSSADLSGNGNLTGTVNFAWRAIGPTAS